MKTIEHFVNGKFFRGESKKTGKVLIHYSTAEELENIIGKLV